MIFAQKCDKEAGRKSIKKWYAKVGDKDFRAQLRGVIDKKFFIFRLVKIFG